MLFGIWLGFMWGNPMYKFLVSSFEHMANLEMAELD
jgi:hypothetical protein